jgi:hypothetical protein
MPEATPEATQTLPKESADKHLEALTSEMPGIVPEAVEAANEADQRSEAAASVVDKWGRPFDPAQHAAGPDGKPIFTATGRFTKVKLPKDRGPASRVNVPDRAAIAQDQNRRAAATVCATMFIQTGMAVFGDEWAPEKSKEFDEQIYLVDATDEYFKMVGVADLPPWAVIIVAYGSYGLKRMARPRTKTIIQRMGGALKNLFGNIGNRLRGIKPTKKTPPTDETPKAGA